MHFVSDNAGPVPERILQAISAVNTGHAMPYGNDAVTQAVAGRLQQVFEAPDARIYLVNSGTAANALALASLTGNSGRIFCHDAAHIQVDEQGAAEFYRRGAKLTPVGGAGGKIDSAELDAALKSGSGGAGDVLSLTQLTEAGTLYHLDAQRTLTRMAKKRHMRCHMDGARFANALVAHGCSAADMTWKSGVDALSFGGTKNGLLGVEAVIFFDPELAVEFEENRLRGGHMISKQRFMAAQYDAYLTDGFWLELAGKANAAAACLENGLSALPFNSFTHKRAANMVFVTWPAAQHKKAHKAGAEYYVESDLDLSNTHDDTQLTARLVCNWATTTQSIQEFLNIFKA